MELNKNNRVCSCGHEGNKDSKTSDNLVLFMVTDMHEDTEHNEICSRNSRQRR